MRKVATALLPTVMGWLPSAHMTKVASPSTMLDFLSSVGENLFSHGPHEPRRANKFAPPGETRHTEGVIDREAVFVGSANINDRSLLGTRDSKLAVLGFV